ncbi:hypothetical protein Tco_0632501 [Tanacetum coccineum]
MAQQVIPTAQLVLKFYIIGRYNNYTVLQSIPCSPKCQIVGQILLDHPLSYALTATADVLFVYTLDMFQDILHLPVETPNNPFVAPVNIETIEAFMNKVGYQGVVDKTKINILQLFHAVINRTIVDYAALLWWDFINNVKQKKEAIQVVPVRGMLIPNEFLTKEIHDTDDFKEYKSVFMKDHKDNPEHVDDDDDKDAEKVDEEEGGKMGSFETKTENMQTPIPTPPRFPRTILSSDKNITQELTETMKRSLQDRANDPDHRHDDHQEDDAPPEGEKRVKRHKALKRSKSARVIDEDEVILKDETSELIAELQVVDKHVRKEFKNFNEEARLKIQHWKDSWHKLVYKQKQRRVRNNPKDYFSNHKITEVVRITTNQPHGLDFMKQIIVMREDDKPDSFSKADFKYLNKNDIEDLYYLCQNKKVNYRETKLMNSLVTFIRSRVIWERVHDFYKNEKWVMYLVEIVKFCDAMLEKILKEVNLKIFQSEPWKKPPLLDEKMGIFCEWKTNSTDDEAFVIINP